MHAGARAGAVSGALSGHAGADRAGSPVYERALTEFDPAVSRSISAAGPPWAHLSSDLHCRYPDVADLDACHSTTSSGDPRPAAQNPPVSTEHPRACVNGRFVVPAGKTMQVRADSETGEAEAVLYAVRGALGAQENEEGWQTTKEDHGSGGRRRA